MSAATPVVSCPTAEAALSCIGDAPGSGTAVLVAGDGSVRVASMTAFGPSVHPLPKPGPDIAASILAEASRRGERALLHAPGHAGGIAALLYAGGIPFATGPGEQRDDADRAVASFMGRRPDVPVTRTAAGGARARGWSVAMYDPSVAVAHGMRLGLRAEPHAVGLALRWREPESGADMGLFALLPRSRMTEAETAEVDGAWAEVTTYAYGLAHVPDGVRDRTVVLVLDIPRALDTGFADGVRPRGGMPS